MFLKLCLYKFMILFMTQVSLRCTPGRRIQFLKPCKSKHQTNSENEAKVYNSLSTDINLPITIGKETKECTKHLLYPFSLFVSFEKCWPSYSSFLISLNTVFVHTKPYEALSYEKWKVAIKVKALEKNKTWEVVDLLKGKRPVGYNGYLIWSIK